MKENRKLLQEIITDIRRDMTDEEVLNLLADSKISVDRIRSGKNIPSGSALPMPLRNLRGAGRLFSPFPPFWRFG